MEGATIVYECVGGPADGELIELSAHATGYVRDMEGTWHMHMYRVRPWVRRGQDGQALWVRDCLVWTGAQ